MTTDQTITMSVLLDGSTEPAEVVVDLADLRIVRQSGSTRLWLQHPETTATISNPALDMCVRALATDVARLRQAHSEGAKWTVARSLPLTAGEVSWWHEPVTRSAILTGRIPDTEPHRAWIAALEQLATEPSA